MYLINLSFELFFKITKCILCRSCCNGVKLRLCSVTVNFCCLCHSINAMIICTHSCRACNVLHNPTSYLNAFNNKPVSSVTARQAPEDEHETTSDTSHSPRLRKLVLQINVSDKSVSAAQCPVSYFDRV